MRPEKIVIRGAREHNLKHVTVEIPRDQLVVLTGVSGSGKSSLVREILFKALSRRLMRANVRPGAHDSITGMEHLDKVIAIDQDPIGRTPRSNPATASTKPKTAHSSSLTWVSRERRPRLG